jgi:hypothetical protein
MVHNYQCSGRAGCLLFQDPSSHRRIESSFIKIHAKMYVHLQINSLVTSDLNKNWNVFESCIRAYKYQIYDNANPAHLILPDLIALTLSEKHK